MPAVELPKSENLFEHMMRPAEARRAVGRNGLPARRHIHLPHVGSGIAIIFAEIHARRHVENLLQAGAAIGRVVEFRQIVRHRSGNVDRTAPRQNAGHPRRHRFRHRLRKMQRAFCHAVEIAFDGDCPVLDDQKPVRIRIIEKARQRRGFARNTGHRQPVKIAFVARQHPHRPRPAPHFRCRQNLPHILERPAVPWRPVPIHFRRNERRRRALHDWQVGIGIFVGRHNHP